MTYNNQILFGDNGFRIEIPREIDDYNYARFRCKHGQNYKYNNDLEKWVVTCFKKPKFLDKDFLIGYLGCDCKVPCSPVENRGMQILERNLAEISAEIDSCGCGHNQATLLHAYRRHVVVIQCNQCGIPRTIDPERIWDRIGKKKRIKEERYAEYQQSLTNLQYFRNRLKDEINLRDQFIHGRKAMIKAENDRITENIKDRNYAIIKCKKEIQKAFRAGKIGKQFKF